MTQIRALLLLPPIGALLLTFAQGTLPPDEQRKYDRQHDSLQLVTAQKRHETDAYNDAYIRKHPNYLRQHPEIVKEHPEYRKRYAKYLTTQPKR